MKRISKEFLASLLYLCLSTLIFIQRNSKQQTINENSFSSQIFENENTQQDLMDNISESSHNYQPNVRLERHSFESPLTRDLSPSGQFEWIFDGASIPTKKHVVLTPAIEKLTGQFFHKLPLITNKFDLDFTFEVSMNHSLKINSASAGLAFWYTKDPFKPHNYSHKDLLGYSNEFEGFGVFFTIYDDQGNFNPKISILSSNGVSPIPLPLKITPLVGNYFNFVNINNVIFKLEVTPISIKGSVISHNQPLTTIFEISAIKLEFDGFIGFSAFSGFSDSISVINPPAKITLKSLTIKNLDLTLKGEDNPDLDSQVDGLASATKLFKDQIKYKSQSELIDAVKQLTFMSYQQISEQTSREAEILRTSRSTLLKLQHLESIVFDIHSAISSLLDSTDKSLSLTHFKDELLGVKQILHQQAQIHNSTIDNLHSKINDKLSNDKATKNEIKTLLENSKEMQQKHSFSSLMIIFLIFIIISFGLFLWKRFRDMEKKHFL